jgi:phosphopantothenoylcysteine decarboxylase/phosphopantothenate--cysteine ligase
MRILITAGPTQEPIDDVRYITNASSGRMGFALAKAAKKIGHKVVVISGPVPGEPKIKGVRFVHVRTAGEMADAVIKELEKGFDVFISAAAVGDYAPLKTIKGKIDSKRDFVLRLKPTRKITSITKKKFPNVYVVAFKAEFNVSKKVLIERASAKLIQEGLDLIIANDIGKYRMGSKSNRIYMTAQGKKIIEMSGVKNILAARILKTISSSLLSL